ncbi:MAG: GIDE domain-containing protein [Burkholderiales bacterium]
MAITFGPSTRMHQPGWLSGAIHFVIIAVAFQAESAEAWPYALLAMSAVSFFAWVANYRRYRQVQDLPTSKVASAAQGYVELFGRTELLPGEPIRSRLSRSPCCWYSYQIEEKGSDDKWKTVDSGTSVEQFLLVDDTGQCVISPEGAEVVTHDQKSWEELDRRYNEWLLLPKGVLYAIGEFSTTTAAAVEAGEERADVGALLAEWKVNQAQLHQRFDLDRDGRISIKEWELARLQARREVRARHAEERSRSVEGVHVLRKPADGRLFLLANEMPDKLGSRYRSWSWAHLVIFLGAGCAGLIML